METSLLRIVLKNMPRSHRLAQPAQAILAPERVLLTPTPTPQSPTLVPMLPHPSGCGWLYSVMRPGLGCAGSQEWEGALWALCPGMCWKIPLPSQTGREELRICLGSSWISEASLRSFYSLGLPRKPLWAAPTTAALLSFLPSLVLSAPPSPPPRTLGSQEGIPGKDGSKAFFCEHTCCHPRTSGSWVAADASCFSAMASESGVLSRSIYPQSGPMAAWFSSDLQWEERPQRQQEQAQDRSSELSGSRGMVRPCHWVTHHLMYAHPIIVS